MVTSEEVFQKKFFAVVLINIHYEDTHTSWSTLHLYSVGTTCWGWTLSFPWFPHLLRLRPPKLFSDPWALEWRSRGKKTSYWEFLFNSIFYCLLLLPSLKSSNLQGRMCCRPVLSEDSFLLFPFWEVCALEKLGQESGKAQKSCVQGEEGLGLLNKIKEF